MSKEYEYDFGQRVIVETIAGGLSNMRTEYKKGKIIAIGKHGNEWEGFHPVYEVEYENGESAWHSPRRIERIERNPLEIA